MSSRSVLSVTALLAALSAPACAPRPAVPGAILREAVRTLDRPVKPPLEVVQAPAPEQLTFILQIADLSVFSEVRPVAGDLVLWPSILTAGHILEDYCQLTGQQWMIIPTPYGEDGPYRLLVAPPDTLAPFVKRDPGTAALIGRYRERIRDQKRSWRPEPVSRDILDAYIRCLDESAPGWPECREGQAGEVFVTVMVSSSSGYSVSRNAKCQGRVDLRELYRGSPSYADFLDEWCRQTGCGWTIARQNYWGVASCPLYVSSSAEIAELKALDPAATRYLVRWREKARRRAAPPLPE